MRRGLLSDPTTSPAMRSGLVVELPNAVDRQSEGDEIELTRVCCGLCGSRPLFLGEGLEKLSDFQLLLSVRR